MKQIGCFLLFVCIVSAVPLYADSDFTLFGAAQHQGKLTVQTASTTARTPSNFDPATFGTFGIRFGNSRVFGHEQTIAYAPNFLEAKTKAVILNGNLMVQAPLPKLKPYATAGLGTIISWGTDDSGRPSFGKLGTKLAINYGGGVKVLPAGPVGIRFDLRGYLIPNAKFNVPVPTATDPLATIKSQSQTLNMLEAGIGIIFSFGK
jgi:opacity protein-like surface antigen